MNATSFSTYDTELCSDSLLFANVRIAREKGLKVLEYSISEEMKEDINYDDHIHQLLGD